jgi:hypothetical protein
MSTRKADIVIPDHFVSHRRSALVAELAHREIKRQHLLEVFNTEEPIWRDEDHPELKEGAAEWVRKMRAESEVRFEGIQQDRDSE